MPVRENYVPHMAIGAALTLAILVSFQVYLVREPARIAADEARYRAAQVLAGKTVFAKNCATCHGDNGAGSDDGPALNNKPFLNTIDDGTLFSVVSSGVPNTQMPAWNQVHGGPLTDEDVRQAVAFLRSWQPTAPDTAAAQQPGDVGRGAAVYAAICAVCHGPNGAGTDRALALNDPARLHQFDDAWYRDSIVKGRPAEGLPTWGTVLAPKQINDLLALIDSWRIDSWRSGVSPSVPVTTTATVPATATAER